MSRIYFHSPSETVELSGRERHYAAWVISRIASSLLETEAEDRPDKPSILRQFLPSDSYILRGRDFQRTFLTWFHVAMGGEYLLIDGKRLDTFTLQLNTAALAGSDAIKLLARIHGQCEIHGWVDGKNRTWLADIAEAGLEGRIMRTNEGWENIIPFLRKTDSEPVVMSYSVTDQFPNAYIAEWESKNEGDDWYDLTREAQWELAMPKLRAVDRGLEMKPETWDSLLFNGGESVFTVLDAINRQRAQSETL